MDLRTFLAELKRRRVVRVAVVVRCRRAATLDPEPRGTRPPHRR